MVGETWGLLSNLFVEYLGVAALFQGENGMRKIDRRQAWGSSRLKAWWRRSKGRQDRWEQSERRTTWRAGVMEGKKGGPKRSG